MCQGGYAKHLRLDNCLIMGTCKYNLISVGRLALSQDVDTWIAPGKGTSYLAFSDLEADRVSLINIDVLLLPGVACCLAYQSVTHGNHSNTKVTGILIHNRFLHRHAATLKRLPQTCKDIPAEWSKLVSDAASPAMSACVPTPIFSPLTTTAPLSLRPETS